MVYYETLPLVLIGSLGDKYESCLRLSSNQLSINFESYVIGQNHLCMAPQLHEDRHYDDYYNAMKFLDGAEAERGSAERALHFFYADLALFLTHYSKSIDLSASVDFPGLATDSISKSKVKDNFLALLHSISGEYEEDLFDSVTESFPYIDFFDSFDMTKECIEVMIKNAGNYSLAAVYNHYAKMSDTKVVVLKE